MVILFVRHGESKANVKKVFSNTGYRHGLTRKGVHQAEALSKSLAEKYRKIDAIYYSPLKRAHETAKVLNKAIKSRLVVDDRLIEFGVGGLEGRSDSASWALFSALWKAWATEREYSAMLPKGESHDSIVRRAKDFMTHLSAVHGDDETVLCVSHGGFLKMALPHLVNDMEFLKDAYLRNGDAVEIVAEGGRITAYGIISPGSIAGQSP